MINELTSVTSPNQIFWIYFLVHLQTGEIVKFPWHALGPAFPINSSGTQGVTGVGKKLLYKSRSPVNNLSWNLLDAALNCKEEPKNGSNSPTTLIPREQKGPDALLFQNHLPKAAFSCADP